MNAAGGAMESPRKFNDCYFYYYSTCTKGDNCVFRHEPAALGCETMCPAWQQGKCIEKRCKLRHMELRKNRKQIPCYWENQPGGCRKKHCPFMHKNPEARTDGIAPSQPGPALPHQVNAATPAVPEVVEAPQVPAPAPAPVPLLWPQQRQVVLDSTILGVLPGPDMLRGRRVLGPHDAPPTYAALPVDPLVVNFEEESDNESAPSSTPTKHSSPDEIKESHELLLLEKIQAEAAAYYHYEDLPPADSHRRIVRTSLNNKYDKMSLDEIAGRKQTQLEVRTSLDFKILSLDEIRARKKVNNDAIVQSKPITLTLNRKRKLSTHECITDSGKVIKVVRSNSVVYKKVDNNVASAHNLSKDDSMESEAVNRKRTYSEQSDVLEINDDELDDSIQFKRVHIAEQTHKPTLVRTISKVSDDVKEVTDSNKSDESDSEVQIVDDTDSITKVNDISSDIIDLDAPNTSNSIDIVDLSADLDESGVVSDLTNSNVPDIVASCVVNSTLNVDSDDEEALINDDMDDTL